MDNKIGKNPEGYPSRINLCFIHHKILHKTIIIPALKIFSLMPNYNHELFLWKNTPKRFRKDAIVLVINKTIEWLEEK